MWVLVTIPFQAIITVFASLWCTLGTGAAGKDQEQTPRRPGMSCCPNRRQPLPGSISPRAQWCLFGPAGLPAQGAKDHCTELSRITGTPTTRSTSGNVSLWKPGPWDAQSHGCKDGTLVPKVTPLGRWGLGPPVCPLGSRIHIFCQLELQHCMVVADLRSKLRNKLPLHRT